MSERDAEPVITMITMDRETSSAVFARSDGKEARFPLETSPFDDTSALSRLQYTPAFGTLLAVTGAGDDILFELPKQDGTDQLGGRVVVYLDQNKWSDIAKAMHDPTRVNEEDRLAARQLAEWAHHRRIILPASSGHYYETTKQFNAEERYGLGLTILQLSRGWQMRDPLQVRRDELYTWFRHGSATVAQTRDATVFTLDPNVMHGRVRDRGPYVAPADFSPDAAFQHEALTSAMALIDLMLDSERIKPGPETGWAGANQRFSDWLDGEDRDSQQKRKCIDAFLLWDLRAEIAEESHAAGATPEQLQRWLPIQSAGDIRELHATGLFGEMLHDRHLNKGTKWRPNDLTDMVYLSCAAGYADFVVCENHMGSVLAQGLKRLGRPQRVFRGIRDAVPAIAAALAGTAH